MSKNLAVNTVGPIDIFVHLLKKSSNLRLILVTSSLGSLQESSDPPSDYYKIKADYPYDSYRASQVALNMILKGEKIKMWGGDPDWLATDLADAETMRKLEAPHPSGETEQIARCVSGEPGADVGKFVDSYGIEKW